MHDTRFSSRCPESLCFSIRWNHKTHNPRYAASNFYCFNTLVTVPWWTRRPSIICHRPHPADGQYPITGQIPSQICPAGPGCRRIRLGFNSRFLLHKKGIIGIILSLNPFRQSLYRQIPNHQHHRQNHTYDLFPNPSFFITLSFSLLLKPIPMALYPDKTVLFTHSHSFHSQKIRKTTGIPPWLCTPGIQWKASTVIHFAHCVFHFFSLDT